MPSICLCLTFYKDNCPQRAGQTESSGNNSLLPSELSQNTTFSTEDSRCLRAILPGGIRPWLCVSHGAFRNSRLCYPRNLASVWSSWDYTSEQDHRDLDPSKRQTNRRLMAHSPKSTMFIPLAAAIASNVPQKYHLPKNCNPQYPTSNPEIVVLTCSWRWSSHLLPW